MIIYFPVRGLEAEEIFWNLVKTIRNHKKDIPKQISTEVTQISADCERAMGCPTGRVDYESALSTLKKLLEENCAKFPKKIQEEIGKTLENFTPKQQESMEPEFGPGST